MKKNVGLFIEIPFDTIDVLCIEVCASLFNKVEKVVDEMRAIFRLGNFHCCYDEIANYSLISMSQTSLNIQLAMTLKLTTTAAWSNPIPTKKRISIAFEDAQKVFFYYYLTDFPIEINFVWKKKFSKMAKFIFLLFKPKNCFRKENLRKKSYQKFDDFVSEKCEAKFRHFYFWFLLTKKIYLCFLWKCWYYFSASIKNKMIEKNAFAKLNAK